MPWRTAWIVSFLLAAAVLALLVQGSGAQSDNLLANGGFESGTEGWLAVGGELAVDDTLVHGGSSAGVFATTEVRAEPRQCLPVIPSSDYEFSGYAARRQEDLKSSLRLRILWWDREECLGQRLWTHDSPLLTLDQAELWYELAVGGRAPDAARSAYLTIEVQESEATVYLDDFAVSRPATPTETPEPSASPVLTPTPPRPIPSDTPYPSPTASSWQMTPVPVQAALRNGGFEEADSQGLPSFWRAYGGELARTNEVRFEGRFAGALTSQTNSTKWAYQPVTIQGGRAYVLSGYALKADPAVAAAYLRLSWYTSPSGSGQAIDSVDSTALLASDSPEFRFLTTDVVLAPVEATSAKVRLMLDPTSEESATVYFDAVTFEETLPPEPTLSPTATPPVVVDRRIPTSTPSTFVESASTPRAEQRGIPAPTGNATAPPPSSPGPGGAGKPTPAVLGAVRPPGTTGRAATAAATASAVARAPVSVYRQRKLDPSVGDQAGARADSDAGGLASPLLALAAGIPALGGASAGVYYWRWRRARPR